MHLSKSFSNSVVRAFPAKKEKKPHRVKIQFSLGIPLFSIFRTENSFSILAYHKSQFRYTPEYRVLS